MIFLIIIVFLLFFVAIFLLLHSPGKLKIPTNNNEKKSEHSIYEKKILEINSSQQGLFIRSENIQNPIILFLHGGPGSPELFLIEEKESHQKMEQFYTVCYWEQRGAGISNNKPLNITTMSLDQFIEDTIAVTTYLRERFNQEKIYLMGHSWGTLLGIKVIQRRPEFYLAYMWIGQVSNQIEFEKIAYKFMLSEAIEKGDRTAIKQLSNIDINNTNFPTNSYLRKIRTKYLNKYGVGMTHQKFSAAHTFKTFMLFEGYTLKDKIHYLSGLFQYGEFMADDVFKNNLFEASFNFKIPIFLAQGKYDYQVSQTLAEYYLNLINAPQKEFRLFQNSAHSPILEEYDTFVNYVKDVFI